MVAGQAAAALEQLFGLAGGRELIIRRLHKAPDELQYSAELECPGDTPRGFAWVTARGSHETLEATLTSLAESVRAFVAHRDGP